MIFSRLPWRPRFSLRLLLVAVAVAAVVTALVGQRERESQRNKVIARVLAIGRGMRTFEGSAGGFPAPALLASDGRKLCSWRMQLAPYIAFDGRAYEYAFAWNEPANQELAAAPSEIFQWDNEPTAGQERSTNVLGITGPGAAFDSERHEPLRFRDEIGDLICAIEVRHSGVHWMQPEDVDYRELIQREQSSQIHLGTLDEGFAVLFLDGEAWFLRADTPRDRLLKLMTIDGAIDHDRDEVLRNDRRNLR